MKTALPLLLCLTSWFSFAHAEFDPSYVSKGVYFNAQEDAEVIETQMTTGMGIGPCGPRTAPGVGCYCNGFVMSHQARPGFYQEKWHWVRDGWHMMRVAGGRGAMNLCRRDQ
ncbi:hypothetical protein AB8Z38_02440 [Bradyrhizobium sp. LLZ17]|uniref:Uncharacterized protein n=1 Tax=Bradyrhizobium sp. LLZ17 TaxID=3239388 RepID=A0AB39XNJ9_9BRAD